MIAPTFDGIRVASDAGVGAAVGRRVRWTAEVEGRFKTGVGVMTGTKGRLWPIVGAGVK